MNGLACVVGCGVAALVPKRNQRFDWVCMLVSAAGIPHSSCRRRVAANLLSDQGITVHLKSASCQHGDRWRPLSESECSENQCSRDRSEPKIATVVAIV